MRLPYLQLAEKFVTVQSKVIARMLGVERVVAIGMGALLFETILELSSTEDTPPTGIVDGDDAGDLIEALMEWNGERGKAFGAFVRADVIEALERGARVKGCDRYKEAWEKQRKRKEGLESYINDPEQTTARAEHARKAAQARWGMPKDAQPMLTDAHRMPKDAHGHAQPMLGNAQNAPQTETETETDKKKLLPAAAVFEMPSAEDFEPDAAGCYRETAWGFWGWHNQERLSHQCFVEPQPPSWKEFKAWHDAAVLEVGADGLQQAFELYLADEDFAARGWPISVFMKPTVYPSRASARAPQRPRR